MRLKKIATTLVLCAAGVSVLGAGNALAEGWHNEVWAKNLTQEECSKRLAEVNENPNVGGAMCDDWNDDGKYQLVVSVRN
ncbi:hypothetical protein A8924_6077 [Saccharopolyspora erythraea NRRL 2338]|uniref:Uncharacterized protein n=2 Tax=Saccharopolyspora erythraea TaxID=1836 RepID=A4FLJ5_SACEN|nr:hypothetical protein [Saccharopolyspora erythraea]EQD85300.1 hypothetical protein N599_15580 [Saccharopolyspora erythraea D]PFG98560.1 hypothetical protein A8924_6077 [Saccharopolyspora erythraea NRRL 2338]QRK88600.1 hypothetical protein JQX30_28740 [Saccharopolyspora erythraea]CAM04920.1 hypothetical protein SACE_5735 [Saccharopolyspora erythraea NRRL 2338]